MRKIYSKENQGMDLEQIKQMEEEYLLQDKSNTNVFQVPRKSRTKWPKEKGIVIKKISRTINFDGPITRSRTIINADRRDNGKKKMEEPPTIAVQHAYVDPMWTVRLCHDDLNVHDE